MARKKAEGEAARVEKEVAKTKRETAELQGREKRKLRDSESCKKRPRVNSAVFTDLCCIFLEVIRRIQEQKGNSYNTNVKDRSMMTVLIMMTPIQVSVHSVDFIHTTFHYVNIFCIVHKLFMKFYW